MGSGNGGSKPPASYTMPFPAPAPFSLSSSLEHFYDCQILSICCVISPLFLPLSIHLELPPIRRFLRRPPVALLPPILPGSQPLVLPNKYELCNLSIKYASSLNWSQGKSQFVNENNLFTDFLTFASLLLNRASRFTVVVLTFGGLTSNAILKEEADIYLRHGLRTRLYEFLS